MANHFDSPPTLMGDEANQLIQMYRYLQAMSDQLNEAMTGITLKNFAPEAQEELQALVSGSSEKKIKSVQNNLRSIVIKSAEIVRNEMDELRTRLTSDLQMISQEYGQLIEQMSNDISVNARGITQNYEYYQRVSGDLGDFVTRSNQYIYTGYLWDDNGKPVYGVAVGENVTAQDGQLDSTHKLATFTNNRLSFWYGNIELAYFSNQMLYINSAEVLKTLKMGNFMWKIQQDDSLGLMVV